MTAKDRTGLTWRRAATFLLVAVACVTASIGTLAVTVAGFALSFDAIRAVGVAAYVNPGLAWMLPVAIDGVMAVAMVTAIVLRWLGRSPLYPWLVVIVGALVSIACNAVHASLRGGAIELEPQAAMAVSAIPALTLALSVHLLITLALAVVAGPTVDPVPDVIAVSDRASAASRSHSEVVTSTSKRPGRRSTAAAVAKVAARMPDARPAVVAAKVGVSESTARRHLARINGVEVASVEA